MTSIKPPASMDLDEDDISDLLGNAQRPADVDELLSFTPVRSLLNPKFVSYRLSSSSSTSATSSTACACTALPEPQAKLATLPDAHASRLSFAEVQARSRHNHLACDAAGEHAFFVDADGAVTAIQLDQVR